MKFDILFRRRWWLMYGPILLVAAVLLWLSYTQWLPQPPHQITIAAGQPGDGYTQIALRYRERLAQVGIDAQVTTNANSDLALQALLTEPPQAQLALVSGLHARTHLGSAQVPKDAVHAVPNSAPALQGLAVIEREPVWVFSRTPLMTKVSELRNMRVGIAAKDPLAKQVADLLIQNAGLKSAEILWIEVPRTQLANDLIDGKIDATIVLASAQSDAVRVLTRSPLIQIIGLEQVGDLTQRESRLRPFVLPQGVIEMRGDIPSRDLTMVAADLQLVIHESMHPALQRTLLDVASQLHETASFLQRQGEFPSITDVDFPASLAALATLRGDKPWLEQLLPYGWAQLAQWLFFACLPILLLTFFVLAWIPSWFEWRINALLQNFYGELKFLETEIDPVASERPIEIKGLLQRIDAIDMQVMQLDLPNHYAQRWYTLRSHLADARERLLMMRAR